MGVHVRYADPPLAVHVGYKSRHVIKTDVTFVTVKTVEDFTGRLTVTTLPMGGVVPHQNPLHKLRDRDRPTQHTKGQGPGLVNVLWAGTTKHEDFS